MSYDNGSIEETKAMFSFLHYVPMCLILFLNYALCV